MFPSPGSKDVAIMSPSQRTPGRCERSEGSLLLKHEMLRFAQHDMDKMKAGPIKRCQV